MCSSIKLFWCIFYVGYLSIASRWLDTSFDLGVPDMFWLLILVLGLLFTHWVGRGLTIACRSCCFATYFEKKCGGMAFYLPIKKFICCCYTRSLRHYWFNSKSIKKIPIVLRKVNPFLYFPLNHLIDCPNVSIAKQGGVLSTIMLFLLSPVSESIALLSRSKKNGRWWALKTMASWNTATLLTLKLRSVPLAEIVFHSLFALLPLLRAFVCPYIYDKNNALHS